MMKVFKGLLVLVFLFSFLSLFAVEEKWVNSYPFPPNVEGVKVFFLDSLVVSMGNLSRSAADSSDIVVLGVELIDGNILWQSVYSPVPRPQVCEDGFIADGAIWLLGRAKNAAGAYDCLVLKFAQDGSLLAETTYDVGGQDYPQSFCQGIDGSIYITGHRDSLGTKDIFVMKCSPSLEVLWSNRFNGPGAGSDSAFDCAVDSSGNLYVVGGVWQNPTDKFSVVTLKYSPDGLLLWQSIIEPPYEDEYHENDIGYRVEIGPTGDCFVLARASGAGELYDCFLLRFNPSGETLFTRRYDNVGNSEYPVDMEIYRDGSIYLGASVEDWEEYTDYGVAKFFDDGRFLWARTYDMYPGEGYNDDVSDIVLDKNGNVYVTGTNDADYDFLTIKYNRHGRRVWVIPYKTEDNEYANSLTLDHRGEIYVLGYKDGGLLSLVKYTEEDVRGKEVLSPKDTFRLNARTVPEAKVESYYGNDNLLFPAKFEIGNFYFSTKVVEVEPYGETTVVFDSCFLRDPGIFQTRIYTQLTTDEETENDTAYGQVVVIPAWVQLASLLPGPKGKFVKDGAGLVAVGDSLIFALKGNNTREFYSFALREGNWRERCSLPGGLSGKRVKKGGALCYGGDSLIYAFKGSNTREFWAYNIKRNQWSAKQELPLGGGKALKGGSALTLANGKIYALKGSNTQEFYSYDPKGDSWTRKNDLPLGARRKKTKAGSALAWDGGNRIYAIKGGTSELWAYDITKDSWYERRPCPVSRITQRKRYFKDGASLIKGDGEFFFALKGSNTQEFWGYLPVEDTWQELETIPKGPSLKKVKGGGAITLCNHKVYALKGNGTAEFWLYHANIPMDIFRRFPRPRSLMASRVKRKEEGMQLQCVRHFRNTISLRFSLPTTGEFSLIFYNILGQKAKEFRLGNLRPGLFYFNQAIELSSGIYLMVATLETKRKTFVATKKLVVIK